MIDVNRLAEASVNELEALLESLFENAARTPVKAAPGIFFGRDPILGHLFISGEDHSAHRLAICKALVADAKFRIERPPGWPDLPLRHEAIKAMIDDDDPRRSVVGLYGGSLRSEGWRPDHPRLAPFAGGLMFDRHTPIEIRNNPELRREFPPAKLKGMTNGWLAWRSPEALALDRKMRRMIKAHEAALAQERMG